MRRSPFTLLVCLVLLCVVRLAFASPDDAIDVLISPSGGATILGNTPLPGEGVLATSANPLEFQQAAARGGSRHRSYGPRIAPKPIVKCKGPVCPVGVSCPAPAGSPPCIVPRRLAGQWELGVQAFFATVSGTVRYPALVFGLPASTISFDNDLGLDVHKVLWEYSAKCQFRPSWAFFYSIMPIHMDVHRIAEHTFYFGQRVIPAGTVIKTNWDFIYQRVGILYQPVFNCSSVVSIRASWALNDQKLQTGSGVCAGACTTVNRTRNMVMSGIEIEKCIRTMCNGGTFSCDNMVDIGYLDGTFALDVQAGFRYSVPLNCSRWGYAKGGYRYLNFQEDRNDLRLDTLMQGWFAELGLIF